MANKSLLMSVARGSQEVYVNKLQYWPWHPDAKSVCLSRGGMNSTVFCGVTMYAAAVTYLNQP